MNKVVLPLTLAGTLAFGCVVLLLAQAEPSDEQPLVQAVMEGDHAEVESLLQAGESPNVTSSDGYTPLMLASAAGGGSMVEMLLKYGAYPDAQTANGVTALALAAGAIAGESSVKDTVNALLAAGANPNPNSPTSPLALAALRDHSDAVEALKDRGAIMQETEIKPVIDSTQSLTREIKQSINELVDSKTMPDRDDFLDKMEEVWESYESEIQSAGYTVTSDDREEFMSSQRNVYDNERLSRGE